MRAFVSVSFFSSFCLSHTLVFLLHLNGFSSATHKENEQWNFKIVDFEWKHQVFNYKKRIRNHWIFFYKLINCKGTQPNKEKREYIMQLFGLFIKRCNERKYKILQFHTIILLRFFLILFSMILFESSVVKVILLCSRIILFHYFLIVNIFLFAWWHWHHLLFGYRIIAWLLVLTLFICY